HFNTSIGGLLTHFAYAFGKMGGTAITQIVAVYRRNDDIGQAHGANTAGQVGRLIDIERIGTAVPDVTEGTAAGALITHNHEGCRALTKAFADVGARSFLANREHIVLAKNPLDIVETRSRRS